jgi:hypothetical protein
MINEGLARALGMAVILAGLSLVLDRFVRPEHSIRITLLVIAIAALSYIAVRRLYRPIALKLDDLDLAELLERRQRGIGQRLTNVLLLPQLREQDPSASPAMIQAAVKEDFTVLQQVDLHATFDEKRRAGARRLDGGGHRFLCRQPGDCQFVGAPLVWRRRSSLASNDIYERHWTGGRKTTASATRRGLPDPDRLATGIHAV